MSLICRAFTLPIIFWLLYFWTFAIVQPLFSKFLPLKLKKMPISYLKLVYSLQICLFPTSIVKIEKKILFNLKIRMKKTKTVSVLTNAIRNQHRIVSVLLKYDCKFYNISWKNGLVCSPAIVIRNRYVDCTCCLQLSSSLSLIFYEQNAKETTICFHEYIFFSFCRFAFGQINSH